MACLMQGHAYDEARACHGHAPRATQAQSLTETTCPAGVATGTRLPCHHPHLGSVYALEAAATATHRACMAGAPP